MERLLAFSTLILMLVSYSLPGMAAKGLSESQAQTFLHDSGLDTLIESMPETMEQQLNLQRLMETNQLKIDEVQSAISQAAQSIQSRDLAIKYLTTKADAESLKGTMVFLASTLGKRIAVEERAASTPDAQMEMQAYAMQMAQTPPPAERIKLVQNLAGALNSDQVILTLMKGTFYSLLDITEALTPDMAATLKSGLDEEWNKMEPMLNEQFGQYMIMGAHYSYRNLADADVKSYTEFLNTPSGQAYWKTGIEIINLYMQAFVKEMVGIIKESKK
tara:strand:+ start:6490 stop:7314 length:825 start_codon:yes stop_codon:yes gene_type:complete